MSRSTSLGVAPGQRVVTPISGWTTLGVSLYGSWVRATKPNIRIRMTPTMTPTGFLMERSMKFMAYFFSMTGILGKIRSFPLVTTRMPGFTPAPSIAAMSVS